MKIGFFGAALVVGCGCANADAQSITPLSATRDVYVESFVVDSNSYSSAFDSDNAHSETLNPFKRTLDRFLQLGSQKATTYSSQDSTLTATGYRATLIAQETVTCPSPGIAFGYSTGLLTSSFRVDSPTRFTFNASVKISQSDADTDALSKVSLVGSDGAVASITRELPGDQSTSAGGVLAPGVYTVESVLDVSTQASPSVGVKSGRVECQIELEFYCPADFDISGFVDLDDHSSFVAAFEAGDPSADFDATGFVDTDDFTAFVTAFESAC